MYIFGSITEILTYLAVKYVFAALKYRIKCLFLLKNLYAFRVLYDSNIQCILEEDMCIKLWKKNFYIFRIIYLIVSH